MSSTNLVEFIFGMKYFDFLGLTSFKFFRAIKGNYINNCESFKVHNFCLGDHCDYLFPSENTCLCVIYLIQPCVIVFRFAML